MNFDLRRFHGLGPHTDRKGWDGINALGIGVETRLETPRVLVEY